ATTNTEKVTAPDSADTASGPSAPGAVSALQMAPPDRCASREITGPSSAIQITAAPETDNDPDTERSSPAARFTAGQAGGGGSPGRPPGPAPPVVAWAPIRAAEGPRDTA